MRAFGLLVALAALVLAGCHAGDRGTGRVRAEDHDAFYLWAGVKPQPALRQARTLYLLAGEVRREGAPHFVPLRAVPQVRGAAVWYVVRAARIDWDAACWAQIAADMARWQGSGNRLAGLQIDFDTATGGLANYAHFLAEARRHLPRAYSLSVTGLMDWGANGDPAALGALQGTVDEVVVQTYQGRSTIPDYQRYVDRLARLPVPYRLALVQGGAWREPESVRRDPRFRGYVVFLLNR